MSTKQIEDSERRTMSEMVWAISSGVYSDYGISLICGSREDAEAAVAEMGGEYRVEEFDFYPAGQGPGVHTIFEARGLEGSMDVQCKSWKQFGVAPVRPITRQVPWNENRSSHPIYVEARCVDRDAAVKSVKDRLAALKAQGDWLLLDSDTARLLGVEVKP